MSREKEFRQRRRRVREAWDYFDRMAKVGPDGMQETFAAYLASLEGKPLHTQERLVNQHMREVYQLMKPLLLSLHAALSRAVGNATGMTLEDFVWLRDYAPPEEGEDE